MSKDSDQLYRVRTKDGAHVNQKVKEDGSTSAIQFSEKNGLKGPVDLVPVDPSEYTTERVVEKEVIVEREVERAERTFREIMLEDVVAPALAELFVVLTERAVDAGIDALKTKVIPATKKKGKELIEKAKNYSNEKKSAKSGKTELEAKKTATESKRNNRNANENTVVHHTQEEVEEIYKSVQYAALYIATRIRELQNTVITDADSSEKAIAMESQLKELSTDDVSKMIAFMLEDKNRDILDEATVQLLEAFRAKELIIEGKRVPIQECIGKADAK